MIGETMTKAEALRGMLESYKLMQELYTLPTLVKQVVAGCFLGEIPKAEAALAAPTTEVLTERLKESITRHLLRRECPTESDSFECRQHKDGFFDEDLCVSCWLDYFAGKGKEE